MKSLILIVFTLISFNTFPESKCIPLLDKLIQREKLGDSFFNGIIKSKKKNIESYGQYHEKYMEVISEISLKQSTARLENSKKWDALRALEKETYKNLSELPLIIEYNKNNGKEWKKLDEKLYLIKNKYGLTEADVKGEFKKKFLDLSKEKKYIHSEEWDEKELAVFYEKISKLKIKYDLDKPTVKFLNERKISEKNSGVNNESNDYYDKRVEFGDGLLKTYWKDNRLQGVTINNDGKKELLLINETSTGCSIEKIQSNYDSTGFIQVMPYYCKKINELELIIREDKSKFFKAVWRGSRFNSAIIPQESIKEFKKSKKICDEYSDYIFDEKPDTDNHLNKFSSGNKQ